MYFSLDLIAFAIVCGISYAIYNKYSGEAPVDDDDEEESSKAHGEAGKEFGSNEGDEEN
jgi:hypothetical protein